MPVISDFIVGGGFIAYVTSLFGFSISKINRIDRRLDDELSEKQDSKMCETLHKQISKDLNRHEEKLDMIGETIANINRNIFIISQEIKELGRGK